MPYLVIDADQAIVSGGMVATQTAADTLAATNSEWTAHQGDVTDPAFHANAEPGWFLTTAGVTVRELPPSALQELKNIMSEAHHYVIELQEQLHVEGSSRPWAEVVQVHDYFARVHQSNYTIVRTNPGPLSVANRTRYATALLAGPQSSTFVRLTISELFDADRRHGIGARHRSGRNICQSSHRRTGHYCRLGGSRQYSFKLGSGIFGIADGCDRGSACLWPMGRRYYSITKGRYIMVETVKPISWGDEIRPDSVWSFEHLGYSPIVGFASIVLLILSRDGSRRIMLSPQAGVSNPDIRTTDVYDDSRPELSFQGWTGIKLYAELQKTDPGQKIIMIQHPVGAGHTPSMGFTRNVLSIRRHRSADADGVRAGEPHWGRSLGAGRHISHRRWLGRCMALPVCFPGPSAPTGDGSPR